MDRFLANLAVAGVNRWLHPVRTLTRPRFHRLSRRGWRFLAWIAVTFAVGSAFAIPTIDSRAYYTIFVPTEEVVRAVGATSTRPLKEILPWMRMTGGGAKPNGSDIWVSDRGFLSVGMGVYSPEPHVGTTAFYGYRDGTCNGRMKTPIVPVLGTKQTTQSVWIVDPYTTYVINTGEPFWCNEFAFGTQWLVPTTTDELSFGMPT